MSYSLDMKNANALPVEYTSLHIPSISFGMDGIRTQIQSNQKRRGTPKCNKKNETYDSSINMYRAEYL